MQFSPVPLTGRNLSPASTPPRRPLPHLMSTSHNGVFGTRMTNENGQNIDIYENPSEHYSGFNNGPQRNGSQSPFLSAFRKHHPDPDQHSSHGFGKYFFFRKIHTARAYDLSYFHTQLLTFYILCISWSFLKSTIRETNP